MWPTRAPSKCFSIYRKAVAKTAPRRRRSVQPRWRAVRPLNGPEAGGQSQGPMPDVKTSIRYDDGMAKQPPKKLTDQMRQAIDDSGLTRYQIAKETRINESALAKFYNGQRGLSMEALNALGEYLQLKITLRRKPSNKGK